MQAVREKGQLQEWLQFFFTAVADQATDAVERAERLADLRETYRRDLASTRSRASEVIELITQPGALNLLRGIERRGLLREMGAIGQGGRMVWVAPEIFSVIADLPEVPRPPA